MDGMILMTALPPTDGHAALIEFASSFIEARSNGSGILYVHVIGLPGEPFPADVRADALRERFHGTESNVVIFDHETDLPDVPEQDPENFWRRWEDFTRDTRNAWHDLSRNLSYVFASETYGDRLARTVGAEFIPFDPYRETVQVKASNLRENPRENFATVLDEFQPNLIRTVTFFGAESTGKTTMARWAARTLGGWYVPEWARPYMENWESHVTDRVMENITYGQFAAQDSARSLRGKPWVFQDTDLLSTIGYYRIYSGEETPEVRSLFKLTRSDLYVVMNSGIPFTPDPLRFGGDVRESADRFWIDLLEEFGCRYHVVRSIGKADQEDEVYGVLQGLWDEEPLYGYRRAAAR